ncbi:MAG: response regulator transcription factor [Deltaproteobacteria bacterium]|nr:response regulator transcription factor [Deltaproteobacteria bacterium]
MAKRRILVVEDDPALREVVADALDCEGYDVLTAATYDEGVGLGVRAQCDLLLLDLVLPGGDGLDLLVEVRQVRPTLPIIISTARGQEDDRIRGLRLGADDYVVKPFSIKELLARVEAVLRRSAERPADVAELALSAGVADLERAELRFDDGSTVALSDRETVLLRYLAQNAGRTISREELLERVWNLPPHQIHTRTIDVHVARLRDKLRDSAATPRFIVTVRGKGYRFEQAALS